MSKYPPNKQRKQQITKKSRTKGNYWEAPLLANTSSSSYNEQRICLNSTSNSADKNLISLR